MGQDIASSGTYTAQEAMAVLGIGSSKFYRLVGKTPIKRYPATERTFLYDKVQIDELAQQYKGKVARRGRPIQKGEQKASHDLLEKKSVIDIVHPEDLPALYYMESIQLGWQRAISPTAIQSWSSKNNHVYWMQYDQDDRHNVNGVLAVLGVLPLRNELINKLLRGDILPNEIKADDILAYESGLEYTCYIASAIASPGHQTSIRQLLQHLLAYWCEHSIRVNRIYALAPETRDDTAIMRLVSECFFSPLEQYINEDGSIAWSLRFERYNPSLFIQEYQKCMQRLERINNTSMLIKTTTVDAPDQLPIERELEGSIKTRVRDFERLQRRLYNVNSDGRMEDERVKKNVWFRRIRIDDDIRACLRINASLFGDSKKYTEDELVAQRRVWLTKNPDIYRVLEVDGEVVGFISAFPLPIHTINRILHSEIRMGDVSINDLQMYTPGVPVSVYLQTIGVHKRFQDVEKRILGMYMASGFRDMINDFGRRGIEIQAIYTRSDEIDGINMSYGLGFQKMSPIQGIDKLVFQLDFSKQDLPFLFEYQHALKEFQTRQSASAIRNADR